MVSNNQLGLRGTEGIVRLSYKDRQTHGHKFPDSRVIHWYKTTIIQNFLFLDHFLGSFLSKCGFLIKYLPTLSQFVEVLNLIYKFICTYLEYFIKKGNCNEKFL